MTVQQIKEKFYKNNLDAIACFVFNEKLNKYVCYAYNVLKNTNEVVNKNAVAKIIEKQKLDIASAVVYHIEKPNPDLYEKFSDFYIDVYANNPDKYTSVDSFCNAFNNYVTKDNNKESNLSQTDKPKIYAYVVNNEGEIENSPIFDMDLTILSKSGSRTCIIENTFTNSDYRGMGIHGMGIKFLESVLAEKNILTIRGKSQECDVYESENNSSLEQHYQKLGFEVDFKEDGSYSIFKCVDPNISLDISKPESSLSK